MLQKRLLVILIILWINILGSLYGYYFYSKQLSETPVSLWLFVPDCPLYTTLFAIVLLLLLSGYRNTLFNLIVSIGLIKYGVWTLFILSSFRDFYFFSSSDIAASAAILFILHMGQALEGFTFPFGKIKEWHIAVALGWFLLNDILDYFGPAVHPFIPPGGDITFVMYVTFAMTFIFTWLVIWLHEKGKKIDVGI